MICYEIQAVTMKMKRLQKAIKILEKKKDLDSIFKAELQIFLQDWKGLISYLQKSACKMEIGLIKRKNFLENQNLEKDYQIYKKKTLLTNSNLLN